MANLWLTGEGEPALAVGTTSDYYRDTLTNLVYYRENNTSWVSVPAFIPNPDGVGTTWLHGSLPPVPEEGSDGDYYYGDVDSIVYRKTGLDWIAKGSLDFIGVYGVQWGNGLGAPANTAPLNNLPAGSFYLDVESSDIYFKPPSMVWELKGQLGAGAGSTTIVVENELDSDSEVNAASVHLAGLVLQEAKDYADNLTPQGVVLSVNGLFPDEGLISLSYADVGADEAGAAATAEQAAKDYADTKQPSDDTLTALSAYNTLGFLVQTAANTFEGRTLTGTSGEITVVNGDGVSGNPSFSLPNSGVTSAVYGSSTRIPVITVSSKGFLTLASDTPITPAFADNLFRVQDNADATKQLALEMGAVSSGTTKTWTVPNCDLNFGKLRHTMVVPSGQTVGAGAYTWPALLAQGGKLDIRMSTGDITTDTDSLLNGGHVVEYTNESAATRTLSLFGFNSLIYDETGTPLSSLSLRTGATAKIVWPTAGGIYARTHGRFYSDEFRLGDATTPTKGITFALSGITAGATRVVTAADANVNMNRLIGYTAAPSNVTVTASPFSRINPSSVLDEDLIVAGGAVSLIEFSRNGSTFYDVGAVAGMFRLSPADRLRITYTVAPTVTSIPR